MVTGTVLRGYGNLEPVPVPKCTRDRIHTVLPVPVSRLKCTVLLEFEPGCPDCTLVQEEEYEIDISIL